MKTLLKIVGGLLLLVILVLAGAAIYVKTYVKPEYVRDQIVQAVQKKTGRNFALEGDTKLSVFPWLGVQVGGMTFGNPPGFGDQPMVKTGPMQVRVQLVPLLSKRVEADTVVIENADINLVVAKDGKRNWDGLGGGGESKSMPLASLAVGGMDIKNANVTWDDQQKGEKYSLKGLKLKTGTLVPGRPVDLDVATDFDAAALGVAGNVAMKGNIEYDLDARKYRSAPLDLKLKLTKNKAGPTGDIALKGNVDADASAQTVKVQELDLDAQLQNIKPGMGGNIKAKGTLDADIAAQRVKLSPADVTADIKNLRPGVDADIAFKGNVEADLPGQKYKLTPIDLVAKLRGKDLPGGAQNAKMTGSLDADLKAGTAIVQGLTFTGLGADLKGDLQAKNMQGKNAQLSGKLDFNATDMGPLLSLAGQPDLAKTVRSLSAQTTFSGSGSQVKVEPLTARAVVENPALGKGPVDVNLNGKGAIDLDKQTLVLSDFAVKGLGLDVAGNLNATGIKDSPKFNGAIKVAPFDLRGFMTQLGKELPTTADPNVLRKTALTSKLSGTSNSLALNGMVMQIDDSTIKGDVSVTDFKNPAVGFKLAIDAINADRYLPPKAAPAPGAPPAPTASEEIKPSFWAAYAGTTGPAGAAAAVATQIPLETLRALKMKGDLTVGKLQINNLKLSNVAVSINARDGDVNIAPAAANLYGGTYKGAIGVNAKGTAAQLKLDHNLQNVQIWPLLIDLNGKSRLAGTGNFQTSVTATGKDMNEVKSTLNGGGNFQFKNGKLKGINIGKLLRAAEQGFVGAISEEEETDFSELGGTFAVKQGVVSNNDLDMKSPLFRITGKGQASLVTDKVDYLLQTTVVPTAKGQGGESLAELSGYTIPVKVSGTISDPKFAPDIAGLVQARAQKELDKQKAKLEEEVQKKVQEELGDKVGKEVQDALKGVLKF